MFTDKLRKIKRKLSREYTKHKRSPKWTVLNEDYLEKCEEAQEHYYKNIVEDLKFSNPSQWYSKLKRMSSHDQAKSEEPNVLSFLGISDQNQAEQIATQFSEISNLYEPLKTEDVSLEETISTNGALSCPSKNQKDEK